MQCQTLERLKKQLHQPAQGLVQWQLWGCLRWPTSRSGVKRQGLLLQASHLRPNQHSGKITFPFSFDFLLLTSLKHHNFQLKSLYFVSSLERHSLKSTSQKSMENISYFPCLLNTYYIFMIWWCLFLCPLLPVPIKAAICQILIM